MCYEYKIVDADSNVTYVYISPDTGIVKLTQELNYQGFPFEIEWN